MPTLMSWCISSVISARPSHERIRNRTIAHFARYAWIDAPKKNASAAATIASNSSSTSWAMIMYLVYWSWVAALRVYVASSCAWSATASK